MYSNPTYASTEGLSAQIFQFDRRLIFGPNGEKRFELSLQLDLTVGTENRFDQISRVGVYHTDARRFVQSFGAYQVSEISASL